MNQSRQYEASPLEESADNTRVSLDDNTRSNISQSYPGTMSEQNHLKYLQEGNPSASHQNYFDCSNFLHLSFHSKFSYECFNSVNMKVIAWNVQGFFSRDTRDYLAAVIKEQDPYVIFLSETKISADRAQILCQRFSYPNTWFVSSVGLSGGLILLWKNGFPCYIVSSADNMIHVLIQSNPSKEEWLLTCMYGSTHSEERKKQWNFIKDLSENVFQPWIVFGDLNVHIHNKGRSASSLSSDNWVRTAIDSAGLMDLGFIGHNYTWTNMLNGRGYKRRRIDMALHNALWIEQYPDSREFGHISEHVNYYKNLLSHLQSLPFSDTNSEQIHFVIDRLSHWEKIEAEYWQQKAGDHWILDVDNNTAYFHSKANRKRARNNITTLKDVSGRWYHKRKELVNLLTSHFSTIATTTNPQLDDSYFHIIQQLVKVEDNQRLMEVPTKEEIYEVLKSMSSWSAMVFRWAFMFRNGL
ncbi:uncharacterized protein LOC113280571 [Papaver somniferum]|uniref:uncharacterized protein LOC113280571 n=1 Tax=Papaver somniferum TaxID=3469 RepID=UPI000E6F66AF|nr:uncharacterized protein LOC113280571 [Papaver somniferum]